MTKAFVVNVSTNPPKRKLSRCLILIGAGGLSLLPPPLSAQPGQTGVDDRGGIDEVIVTAQRREESVQSVGITMSVVTREEIDSRGLRDLPEVANALPNVELFEDFSGAGVPTWIIRGVGLQDFNTNNTPTASVFLDEAYQTSTTMGGAGLFDVERVEVLKGPQGGLYGRNTTGGAVLLNTRRAQLDENSGEATVTYGSWETTAFEGAANFALTENAAWRLAGRARQRGEGWQTSLADDSRHGEQEAYDLRSWLRIDPSDDLSIEWKIQGGVDNSEVQLGRSIGVYGGSGGALFCDSIVQGQRSPTTCLSWAGYNQLVQGQPQTNLVNRQSDDGKRVLSDPINRQENDYISNVLLIRKQLPGSEFSSITAWDIYNYGISLDMDGAIGEYAHRFSSSDIEVLSQEFRLVSDTGSRLDWLTGLSLSEERFKERRQLFFRDNFLVIQNIGLSYGNVDYDQDTSSAALYGGLNYMLADDWTLNASLRYTWEEKDYHDGNLYVPGNPPFYVFQGLSRDYKLDDNVSGNLGLEWTPDENLLLYASLARGFKSGGFYGGFPSFADEVNPYSEETMLAYEIGMKHDLEAIDARLNAAVFYYDYDDVQGFVTRLNALTNVPFNVLSNQGGARHSGAELDFAWQLIRDFDINLTLAYLDARFRSDGAVTSDIFQNPVTISGTRPYAPRWSGSFAMQYDLRLGGDLGTRVSLFYDYRSEFSGTQNSLAETALYQLDGYGVWHANLELTGLGERWELGLRARNLLDKTYKNRVKSDGLQGYIDLFGEPRSLYLDLTWRW